MFLQEKTYKDRSLDPSRSPPLPLDQKMTEDSSQQSPWTTPTLNVSIHHPLSDKPAKVSENLRAPLSAQASTSSIPNVDRTLCPAFGPSHFTTECQSTNCSKAFLEKYSEYILYQPLVLSIDSASAPDTERIHGTPPRTEPSGHSYSKVLWFGIPESVSQHHKDTLSERLRLYREKCETNIVNSRVDSRKLNKSERQVELEEWIQTQNGTISLYLEGIPVKMVERGEIAILSETAQLDVSRTPAQRLYLDVLSSRKFSCHPETLQHTIVVPGEHEQLDRTTSVVQ